MLWLYYEDLLTNAKQEIIKIAKFLNVYHNLGTNNNERNTIIDRIVNESSFKRMKSDFNDLNVPFKNFFRKGIMNDWKGIMTQKQINDFNQLNRYYFYNSNFKFYSPKSKL